MRRFFRFLRQETVLSISLVLALFSMVPVPPDRRYLSYIDWQTIAMLFCLMITVQSFVDAGLFGWIKTKLEHHTRHSRNLALLLVELVFFCSMLVTNDVSLIAFVPFTLSVWPREDEKGLRSLVVLETIAANLGSMLLPVGNPQNLYLYSTYGIPFAPFFLRMLPFSIASLVLLVLLVLLLPFKGAIGPSSETNEKKLDRRRLILTTLQFLLCLATVVRIVDWRLTFFLLTASMVLFSRHLFRKVDYALLLTFIAFFVFSGNMARIPQLDSYIQGHIEGHAFGFALIASQIISNVPAAILLSRFTDAGMGLVYGTNIGGLGTLVASLASLISFKAYGRSGYSRKAYLATFTLWNVVFLAALVGVWALCS